MKFRERTAFAKRHNEFCIIPSWRRIAGRTAKDGGFEVSESSLDSPWRL